jgi:hypothetical protein
MRQHFFHMDSFCPCASGILADMKRKLELVPAVQIELPKEPIIEGAAERVSESSSPDLLPARGEVSQNSALFELSMADAVRLKSAELWLRLGQPAEALEQLEALEPPARNRKCVLKVHLAALNAARGQIETAAQ